MLGGARSLVLFVLLLVLAAAPAEAAPDARVVSLEGQLGPYTEYQDLHLGGTSFKGAVLLRPNETSATLHLEIQDRSVGHSDGYVVRVCREECGLSHDDPAIARMTGFGPFDMTFSVKGLDVLHYRVGVKDGIRIDADVAGTLRIEPAIDSQPEGSSSALVGTIQRPPDPPYAAVALAFATLGAVLAAPALLPLLRRALPTLPLLGLFTRRESLLDHPVRRRLHQIIRDVPGIHLRELRRQMQMQPGQVDHHLRKLVQAGYVVTHAVRGYTAHFVPGSVDRRLMAALARVKSDAARSLLSRIADGGCVTLGRAAERLGIATSTASYHLGALERLGLVEVRTNGHDRWRVTALGRSFLELIDAQSRSGSRNGPESA